MLVRLLIFLAIVLLLFVPLNWLVYRQLVRIHPKRRRWIRGVLIVCNLLWPFLFFLRTFNPAMRVIRALLGPPWFAWLSFLLLYAAFLFLVLLAWIPFRRRRAFPEFARWPSRVFLSLLLAGWIVGIYHALVPLRVERVPVTIDALPPSLEGTRLVLMGDLHVGLFTRPSRLRKIFATANALQPRAVLLAGDMIDDDPFFVPKLLDGTRSLDASIPILAVLGNHEMYGDPRAVTERMRGSRIRLLVNEGHALGDLWIAGISDFAASEVPGAVTPDLAKALAAKPPASLALALAHQPKVIDAAKSRAVPLAVCAHTHGGQCGFRPLRWSLAGVFLTYHMGLYRVGPTQLYVNTGTGYWLVPFRLGMTPEITLIELRGR
ncbi:MAG TPA: metallophosphoesterase [Thermoanaerobaculia bacterium]|nr:metallophosphoesterase [Thermoanaerobaculia bacterium]